jgi:HD-like signal output (HDOD) protein
VRVPGRNKIILREAMRKHLPPSTRERHDKADYSHMLAETILQFIPQFEQLAVYQTGWLENAKVVAMARDFLQNWNSGSDKYIEDVWSLWMIISVE